jgi:hypothetical protein
MERKLSEEKKENLERTNQFLGDYKSKKSHCKCDIF